MRPVPVTISYMPDEADTWAHAFRAELYGLIGDPTVPLVAINRWLDGLGHEYLRQRHSLRSILLGRAALALATGDLPVASMHMAGAQAAPSAPGSCPACDAGDLGRWRAALADDPGALEHWAPVLDDAAPPCPEQPHRALADALLPLTRTGQRGAARAAHLRGYPLVRQNWHQQAAVGQHLEFCALTGNEARGLQILAEHAGWLAGVEGGSLAQVQFATGVCVLLRRLAGLGHGGLVIADHTVNGWLALLEPEIQFTSGRYDVRNGTAAVSERIAQRLAQAPLTGELPLGYPARLPGAAGPRTGQAVATEAAAAVGGLGAGGGLDDLVARARRLRDERRPEARAAWEQVAAASQQTGQKLADDVAAELARQRAGVLADADPRAGYKALLAVAGQFSEHGDQARACEARASAAMALTRAGDQDEAAGLLAAAITEAGDAHREGTITDREYLAVRRARPLTAFQDVLASTEQDPAGLYAAAGLLEAELAEAQRLGVVRYEATYYDLLGQLWSRQGDHRQAREHLDAAKTCYLEAGEPWQAAATAAVLAQAALYEGDAPAAEALAQEAIDHGDAVLPPPRAAGLRALLADTLSAQPGRETDLVEAALTAAAHWDGLSEADAVHQTFQAARGYSRLGRHGEAASLFAEVIARVELPYEAAVIAMTRDQYGNSLRALDRHGEAAEQFLQAATLIRDDPDSAGPVAHLADLAADSLQRSGQDGQALPVYRWAGELYAGLGDVASRARCLRAAAWLEFRAGAGDETAQAGIRTMAALVAELTQLEALAPDDDGAGNPGFAGELAVTRAELDEMHAELTGTVYQGRSVPG